MSVRLFFIPANDLKLHRGTQAFNKTKSQFIPSQQKSERKT